MKPKEKQSWSGDQRLISSPICLTQNFKVVSRALWSDWSNFRAVYLNQDRGITLPAQFKDQSETSFNQPTTAKHLSSELTLEYGPLNWPVITHAPYAHRVSWRKKVRIFLGFRSLLVLFQVHTWILQLLSRLLLFGVWTGWRFPCIVLLSSLEPSSRLQLSMESTMVRVTRQCEASNFRSSISWFCCCFGFWCSTHGGWLQNLTPLAFSTYFPLFSQAATYIILPLWLAYLNLLQ